MTGRQKLSVKQIMKLSCKLRRACSWSVSLQFEKLCFRAHWTVKGLLTGRFHCFNIFVVIIWFQDNTWNSPCGSGTKFCMDTRCRPWFFTCNLVWSNCCVWRLHWGTLRHRDRWMFWDEAVHEWVDLCRRDCELHVSVQGGVGGKKLLGGADWMWPRTQMPE